MGIRADAQDNTDCDLVSRLWTFLSAPSSGKWYLGNIIRDGVSDSTLGISIPPFPSVDVGDVPEQTMFKWALEYVGVTLTDTVLSGLGSYTGGTMNCTPVSADETVVDLDLTFAETIYSGDYDVGTSGLTGCAIATAAGVLGASVTKAAGEEERLELATWYRDVALNESEPGQVAVGTYYLHEDTIEKVTTANTNAASQYRQALAKQKQSADAVNAATHWYKEQQSGQNPKPPAPTMGSSEQYAGGFLTYVKLQYAVSMQMALEGLELVPGNEYAELLNAMTQFNGQVTRFQKDFPGQRDAATVMSYVATAEEMTSEELAAVGVEGIPLFDLESGEVTGHAPVWAINRDRARAAWAARAPRAGQDEPFHILGTFADQAQQLTLGVTVAFRNEGDKLIAETRSTRLHMSNLRIILGNRESFDAHPGLYDKAVNWIANTQSFQDMLKAKAALAFNSPAVLSEFTSVLNAGLAKLGLQ